jgi:anion-transporting  ArsA/GET3 family ATPase
VVTIDPAKRLADALGLESLTNQPGRIDGEWPGQLWALMLDTKSTFDDLVTRYSASPEQAAAIHHNPLYRNISGALSGTQEYMAMEKLYELHEAGKYDLIVIDTPPSRHALDFLDAPRRLTRFLDNRIFRLLVMPTRAYLRAVSVATQAFVRTVSRVIGAQVVKDAVAFFAAFEGMEEGFRNRAQHVDQLLSDPETSFVLVAAPRRDAVAEALYFANRLAQFHVTIDALIVNRVHPRFGDLPAVERGGALEPFLLNLEELGRVAAREEHHLADLASRVSPAPVVRVPFLQSDVHDIAGLVEVGDHLFGRVPSG